jgi:hypothetical protein
MPSATGRAGAPTDAALLQLLFAAGHPLAESGIVDLMRLRLGEHAVARLFLLHDVVLDHLLQHRDLGVEVVAVGMRFEQVGVSGRRADSRRQHAASVRACPQPHDEATL